MKEKHLCLFLLLFFLSGALRAQVENPVHDILTPKDYDTQINLHLKKSKNQKRLAWIFLGGGTVLNIIGSSMEYSTNGYSSGTEVISGISGVATIASIPLFFIGSKNHNRAQMLSFQKEISYAPNDSIRRIYIEDAVDYFSGKARSNMTTAIIISAAGGALIIGGISAMNSTYSDVDVFWGDAFIGSALVASGITVGLLSIPFYTRAANHRNTARMILRTGRVSGARFLTVSPTIGSGRYVSVGVALKW